MKGPTYQAVRAQLEVLVGLAANRSERKCLEMALQLLRAASHAADNTPEGLAAASEILSDISR